MVLARSVFDEKYRPWEEEPEIATFVEQTELDTFSGVVLNAVGALAGKIVTKWVNKAPEGTRLAMPASVKADGNSFEIGISYRNDSPTSITGGIRVEVTRPDGYVLTPENTPSLAIDWAGMSPGATLSKEYNIAKVDRPGQWTVVLRFLAR